jgi:hypothetical protein
LEKVRTTTAESRETETAQYRRERLEENRMRMTETRQAVMRLNFNLEAFNYDRIAAETPQQRQARLEQTRTRNAESRAAKTPQQRHLATTERSAITCKSEELIPGRYQVPHLEDIRGRLCITSQILNLGTG